MKTTQIVIKEFGWIISEDVKDFCPNDKKDPGAHACLPQKNLDALISFIRRTPSMEDFMEIKYHKKLRAYIQVKNYVGEFLLKDGIKLQILPKIYFENSEDRTREIYFNMLLGSRKLSEKQFHQTQHSAGNVDLLESYIHMYLLEAGKLVKRGLKSFYEEKSDNLTCFRGKLQISQHLRKNLITKDHFYVSYEAFTRNRPENRLIKAALQKLLQISTSEKNRKEARRLLLSFDEITASADYKQDFAKIQSDRNSRDYTRILPWTDAILQNKGMLQFSEGFEAASILFAMEEVFENYVANQIKKQFQDVWDVSAQTTGQTLFNPPKGSRKPEKMYFRLRPDIVMRHRNQSRTVVLDTKWKQVPQNPYYYPESARDDMYQMYAYAGRFQVSDIVLLYPKTKSSEQYDHYNCLQTAAYGHTTTIHLFFIDLTDMEKSMAQLEDLLNQEEGTK